MGKGNKEYKIWAISYSDENFEMSKKLNLITAKYVGKADYIKAFGPENLSADFRDEVSDILRQKRGGGYWVWKPYIILECLKQMDDGDYLIYTDAGLIYVDKISKLIDLMRENGDSIFLSSGFVPCKDWTKRDAFVLMGCDCKRAEEQIMVSGGYIVIRRDEKSGKFINDWLRYAKDKRIITDIPNQCGKRNHPNFKQHRHDQSILSLLAFKYNICPYKAVSCVDEPKAHRKCISGTPDGYRYSFYVRLRYIEKEHRTSGYNRSKYSYGRLFVNTRIRDTGWRHFLWQLIVIVYEIMKTDIWGYFWDEYYIECARRYRENHEQ